MESAFELNLPIVAGLTLAVGLVTLLVWSWLLKERDLYPELPGPPRHFLMGNVSDLVNTPYFLRHLQWSKEYGRILKLRFISKWVVLITEPEMVKEITTKHFRAFHDRPDIFPPRDLDPRGLLMGKGAYWEGVRSAVVPLFHSVSLKKFGEIMARAANTLARRIRRLSEDAETSFEILTLCQAMAFDVIGSSAFGLQLNMQDGGGDGGGEGQVLIKTLGSQVSLIGKFRTSKLISWMCPPLAPLIFGLAEMLPWCQMDREMAKNRISIQAKGKELVMQAREKHAREGGQEAKDFISLLVATRTKDSGRPLTDDEIQALTSEFLVAGSETTATTIASAVYLLSLNPDKEAIMRAEIDAYFQRLRTSSANTAEGQESLEELHPTYEELSEFPYVEQVVQETLRMNPPAAGLIRDVLATTTILGDKYQLRRGSRVIIPVYAMHYDPELFPRPDEFRPERFAPGSEEKEKRHPYAFIPFGAGPRMCIGHRFAMEEARLALVRLYKEFSFTVDKSKMGHGPIELDPGLVLKPKNGIHVFAHRVGGS